MCVSILAPCTGPGSTSTASASLGLYLLAALSWAWQRSLLPILQTNQLYGMDPGIGDLSLPPSPSFYNLPSVLGQLLVSLFWVGKEEPADGLHVTSGLAWSKSASGLPWSKSAFCQNCCSFPASPWPSTHKICHGASLRSRKMSLLIAQNPPVARCTPAIPVLRRLRQKHRE